MKEAAPLFVANRRRFKFSDFIALLRIALLRYAELQLRPYMVDHGRLCTLRNLSVQSKAKIIKPVTNWFEFASLSCERVKALESTLDSMVYFQSNTFETRTKKPIDFRDSKSIRAGAKLKKFELFLLQSENMFKILRIS